MRFKFRYLPAEDRLQFNLATDELHFACWLTRRQCLTWLNALRGLEGRAAGPDKGAKASAPKKTAAGPKVRLDQSDTPVQQLQGVTIRASQDRVTVFFKPLEGETVRFVQGRNVADRVYQRLYAVVTRAGWDPEAALERFTQAKKSPAASHSLH